MTKGKTKQKAEDKPHLPVLVDVFCMHGNSGRWHLMCRYDVEHKDKDGNPTAPPPALINQQFVSALENGFKFLPLPGDVTISVADYSAIRFQIVPAEGVPS